VQRGHVGATSFLWGEGGGDGRLCAADAIWGMEAVVGVASVSFEGTEGGALLVGPIKKGRVSPWTRFCVGFTGR
jgi:hypothetical protein